MMFLIAGDVDESIEDDFETTPKFDADTPVAAIPDEGDPSATPSAPKKPKIDEAKKKLFDDKEPQPGPSGTKRKSASKVTEPTGKKITKFTESLIPTSDVQPEKVANPEGTLPHIKESTHMQVDTAAGNDPNTRGTLQGEVGSRKQQKNFKFHPSVSNSNMTNNMRVGSKCYVFVFDDTREDALTANKLADLLTFIYPKCPPSAVELEVENKTHFICYWHPNFNINFCTLRDKIGMKYNDTTITEVPSVTILGTYDSDYERAIKIWLEHVNSNEIKLYTLDELVNIEAERKRKYWNQDQKEVNVPPTKRIKFS